MTIIIFVLVVVYGDAVVDAIVYVAIVVIVVVDTYLLYMLKSMILEKIDMGISYFIFVLIFGL